MDDGPRIRVETIDGMAGWGETPAAAFSDLVTKDREYQRNLRRLQRLVVTLVTGSLFGPLPYTVARMLAEFERLQIQDVQDEQLRRWRLGWDDGE